MIPSSIYYSDVPSRAVMVYLYLKSRSNKDTNTCFPSLNTIAKDLHLSKSTVIRAIKDLKISGFIETQARTRANGANSSTLYKILK